jgi:hypothetical protein
MLFRFLRSPRFKIVTGISLALAGMACVIAKSKVDGRWNEMQGRLAEVQAELESASNVREPVGGVATEGLAWEAYAEAATWMREHSRGREWALAMGGVSEAGAIERRRETNRMASELAVPLAAIQRGARMGDATRPVDWSAGSAPELPQLMASSVFVDALTLLGLAELETGQVDSGCARILDALQFGQDLALSPMLITQMIGTSQTVPRSLRTFLEREGLSALPREGLVQLEQGIGKLIERAPVHSQWRGELVTFGYALRSASSGHSELFGIEGFSGGPVGALAMKWQLANGVLKVSQIHKSLEALHGTSYQQRVQELCSEFTESSNPVLSAWRVLGSANASLRHNLVCAGQLQRALRRVLELPELPFPDPFGKPLTETDDGEVMSFHVDNGSNGIELKVKY